MDDDFRSSPGVCFTGHRPNKLGGYKVPNPVSRWVKSALKRSITESIEAGFRTFISGGALGVDQWAAEIVLELRNAAPDLQLVLARPFPSQARLWPAQSVGHYEKLLASADRVVDVCQDPYAPWKMQERNKWMVDHAERVVAVWDGSTGGPLNTIRYALKHGTPILRINPAEKTLEWMDQDASATS